MVSYLPSHDASVESNNHHGSYFFYTDPENHHELHIIAGWYLTTFNSLSNDKAVNRTAIRHNAFQDYQVHIWALKSKCTENFNVIWKSCLSMYRLGTLCGISQRYPLKFQTKYLTHALKDMSSIQSSKIEELMSIFEMVPTTVKAIKVLTFCVI